MRRIRVIPTLLLNADGGLVKTIKFGKRTYIGDPINAVKIFNDKGADELLLLDIDASQQNYAPRRDVIEEIVSEAFMPVGYGGGIRSVDQAAELFRCGIEKVVLATAAVETPELISEISQHFGDQSTVVCLNLKKSLFGRYGLRTAGGRKSYRQSPVEFAKLAVGRGAGEIIVNSIDRDGTFSGYDQKLLKEIAVCVDVPVVACGGARTTDDFVTAVKDSHCAAVAAGSMFLFQGSNRGILISYPPARELEERLFQQL